MTHICLLISSIVTVILVTIGFYMILAKKKKDVSDGEYISMQLKGFGMLQLSIIVGVLMLSFCALPHLKRYM